MIKELDGILYLKMIKTGAARLCEKKSEINDLNVFPIPDGDTGDNMLMTLEGGLSAEPRENIGLTAAKISEGMLLGARGNSGVILSRIFHGIAQGLASSQRCSIQTFGKALRRGVEESYGAVSKPVEGTILTVFKDGVEYADSRIANGGDFKSYFYDLLREFNLSLERTPQLLPILKESGVVDSGGAGLICIFSGMYDAICGNYSEHRVENTVNTHKPDFSLFTEDSELEFGYCTEFLLRLQNSKTDISAFDQKGFISQLNSMGDSVVCFREDTIIKVHIHTKCPGDILSYCQRYGEFLTLKIENMTLQHNETQEVKDREYKKKAVTKPYGIIAVASGRGIVEAFRSLGCDYVVEGGQSMNPSAEDFIRAFKEVNARTILVYPNNSNIVMAAEQAAELYKNADICIIPTKTIGEGYAGISMLDTSSGNTGQIKAEQAECICDVVTGIVSQAVRDTEKDGIAVNKDDYIGFVGDKILVDDKGCNDALIMLAEKLNAQRYDIMLVICGENVTTAEANEVEKILKQKYRRTEIVMIYGEQPIYDYILVLE